MRENCRTFDVAVVGAGPAGLAAALAAERQGSRVLLIEREARLGGILKQCVHDGFGLVRFGEKLAGPEYAHRFLSRLSGTSIQIAALTFVSAIKKTDLFGLELVSAHGLETVLSKTIVLATGCRERTAQQVAIHGTRPAGVFTAGSAQYYTNILGKLPAKRCVILGSGDIGLIMARRLTLEGAKVLGVYEAKSVPSGLPRNLAQCLHDFDIPLYLSKTVTRCFGDARLTAVEIADVDENMRPIDGTQQILDCDTLVLSVGLIPENELAETLGVALDSATKGAVTDQDGHTSVDGVFACGNCVHVNDLVDYVSESGETAGAAAARYAVGTRKSIPVRTSDNLLYCVPQKISITKNNGEVVLYFRVKRELQNRRLTVRLEERTLLQKNYKQMRPPEMERIAVKLPETIGENETLYLQLEVNG
ncbi:MAG: NAD(P)/FAD-dependent oxidoreductase [Oscillospiraceae bacterium]|jgi:thioredoxin reductase|nr:NAD(P)/FAD-dependent oxidoreductase [Oscillospiraceae bacterium]